MLYFYYFIICKFLSISFFNVSTEADEDKPSAGVFMQ